LIYIRSLFRTGAGAFFRSDKKAKAFRDDYGECQTIVLESGTFETTEVASRIIVIDKPAVSVKVLYGDEPLCHQGYPETASRPPIPGAADQEYLPRLDAKRVTAEFGTKSTRRLDAGRKEIADSPLFGGERQLSLW